MTKQKLIFYLRIQKKSEALFFKKKREKIIVLASKIQQQNVVAMKMNNVNLLYDSKQFKSKKFLNLLHLEKRKGSSKSNYSQKMRSDNGTVQMLNILILAIALWW